MLSLRIFMAVHFQVRTIAVVKNEKQISIEFLSYFQKHILYVGICFMII